MGSGAMARESGFYWISEDGAEPEVACWHSGRWWLAGSEEPALARLVAVLGARLSPGRPAEARASLSVVALAS